MMKVRALEHRQYGGYRAILYHDVTETKLSKNGKYLTLVFSDGGKVRKLSELIIEITEE